MSAGVRGWLKMAISSSLPSRVEVGSSGALAECEGGGFGGCRGAGCHLGFDLRERRRGRRWRGRHRGRGRWVPGAERQGGLAGVVAEAELAGVGGGAAEGEVGGVGAQVEEDGGGGAGVGGEAVPDVEGDGVRGAQVGDLRLERATGEVDGGVEGAFGGVGGDFGAGEVVGVAAAEGGLVGVGGGVEGLGALRTRRGGSRRRA